MDTLDLPDQGLALRLERAELLWSDPDSPGSKAIALARGLAQGSAPAHDRLALLSAAALLGDPMAPELTAAARGAWAAACRQALGDGGEVPIHGEACAAGDELSWAYGRSSRPDAFLARLASSCGEALWAIRPVTGTVEGFEASLAERIACKMAGPLFCSGALEKRRGFWSDAARLGRLGPWARRHGGLDPSRCAGAMRDSAALCHFPAASRGRDRRLLRLAMLGLFGEDLAALRSELLAQGASEAAAALQDPAEEIERAEIAACLAPGAREEGAAAGRL